MKGLPGMTGQKDAKGHDVFKCFLCGKEGDIFQGQGFCSTWHVCYKCIQDAVTIACEAEEDALHSEASGPGDNTPERSEARD